MDVRSGKPDRSTATEAELPEEFCDLLAAYDSGDHHLKLVGGPPLTPEQQQLLDEQRNCLDLLHQAWPDEASSSGAEDPIGPAQALGDFRIVRELGRGGMGVVYEAEQLSMGRRVALKLLPFAALTHHNALRRFRNEVRAAAALDHPHIVSVHSVGEERGIHYYAMQLVRGQSLANLIRDLRREQRVPQAAAGSPEGLREGGPAGDDAPTIDTAELGAPQSTHAEQVRLSTVADTHRDTKRYRSAAQLGIQAAEALQHAHDQGVLHRDIKPGNLLLDGEGQLYVTDFGLARIEADAGMTMTGDIVGTLRYMAPEQALAKSVVIDHRTDIYGLGATLYELLALRPAFGETDRSELLKQIAFEEPKPLRKLDRHIPAELETIVRKAMAKSPDERYQTAQELADDLQAFLEDRPIKAKPPTLLQRTGKWSRRHVGVVWTTTAASLLMCTVLASATAMIAESRQSAVADRTRAEEQRNHAVTQRNEARLQHYYAEVVSGQTEMAEENLPRLQQKLVRHLPLSNEPDYRNWEWYYLFSHGHPEERVLQTKRGGSHAAWSPDGELIATPGKIWRVDTGECVRHFTPSFNLLTVVTWSPDGQTLAWGVTSDDSAIYLWDRQTDDVGELRGAEGSVWALAFSPDGTKLASGSLDQTVRVWDWAAGKVVVSAPVAAHVTDLAWSPDGKLLTAAVRDHLYIWETEGDELQLVHHKRHAGGNHHRDLSWSPDGQHLAMCTSKKWSILDATDWSETFTHAKPYSLSSEDACDIAWSPRGDRIAVTNWTRTDIWDAKSHELLKTLSGHMQHVNSVSWSPDGQGLATADGIREIRIWDVPSSLELPVIETGQPIVQIDWDSDGETIRTVSANDLSCSSWSVASGELLESIPTKIGEGEATGLLSPNRQLRMHWANSGEDNESGHQVVVRHATTGAVHSVWHGSESKRPWNYAWSPDSEKLGIVSRRNEILGLELWDVHKEQPVTPWMSRETANDYDGYSLPTWSPDSSRIAVVGPGDLGDNGNVFWSSHVHLFDAAKGSRVMKRPFGNRPRFGGGIQALAWSPDGRLLAQGTSRGMVEIIDTYRHLPAVLCTTSDAPIRSIAWHPDGKRLAVSSGDAKVKVIEPRQGSELLTFRIDSGYCTMVSWSPNGRRLAVANEAGDIRVWDASRGFEFAEGEERWSELAWNLFDQSEEVDRQSQRDYLLRTLEVAPQELEYRFLRGSAYARLGQFDKAAREFAAAVPDQIEQGLWMARWQAWALLGARDLDAYRTLQASMMGAVHDSDVWSKRLMVAWLGALITGTTEEFDENVQGWLDELSRLHQQQAYDDPGLDEVLDHNGHLIYGALLYRKGEYAQAERFLNELVERLGESAAAEGQHALVCAHYFLAMARFQMGHEVQAARLLEKADDLAQLFDRTSPKWNWTVEYATLRREASEMIQP